MFFFGSHLFEMSVSAGIRFLADLLVKKDHNKYSFVHSGLSKEQFQYFSSTHNSLEIDTSDFQLRTDGIQKLLQKLRPCSLALVLYSTCTVRNEVTEITYLMPLIKQYHPECVFVADNSHCTRVLHFPWYEEVQPDFVLENGKLMCRPVPPPPSLVDEVHKLCKSAQTLRNYLAIHHLEHRVDFVYGNVNHPLFLSGGPVCVTFHVQCYEPEKVNIEVLKEYVSVGPSPLGDTGFWVVQDRLQENVECVLWNTILLLKFLRYLISMSFEKYIN